MKKLLLLVSIFAIAACSSTPKDEETPAQEPMVQDASAADSTPAPAPAEEPQQNNASMDEGTNMDGGFPDVEGTERSGATCKNGGEERLVSVIDTREGPCGVVYTKGGNKKTIAYAKNDMSFCDKVFSNVVGNLTSGGYDCGGAGGAAQPAEQQEEQPAQEEAAGGESQEESGK